MKDHKRTSFSKLALVGSLAAVLAPGAALNNGAQSQRANAGTQEITRSAQSKTDRLAQPAPTQGQSQAIQMIGGMGGDPVALFARGGGRSPKDWGMSKACAQMVRKNRMRSMGISAQRI